MTTGKSLLQRLLMIPYLPPLIICIFSIPLVVHSYSQIKVNTQVIVTEKVKVWERECLSLFSDEKEQYVCWRSGKEHVKYVTENDGWTEEINNPYRTKAGMNFLKWKRDTLFSEQYHNSRPVIDYTELNN